MGIGPPGGLGRLRALLQTCNRFVPGFLAGSRGDDGVGGKMWACDGTAGVFCEVAIVRLLAVGHSAGTRGVGFISLCVCAPRVSGAATALRVAEFPAPALHPSAGAQKGVFLCGVLVRTAGKHTAALVAVLRSHALFGAAGAGFVVPDHAPPHTLFKAGAPVAVAIGIDTSAGHVPADAHVYIWGGAIGKGTFGCFHQAGAGIDITLGTGGV